MYVIWSDTRVGLANLASGDGLAGGFFWLKDTIALPGLGYRDLQTIAPLGRCIGRTSQGDQIREWAGSVEAAVAMSADRLAAKALTGVAALDAEIEAGKRAAALIAKGGSRIYPGVYGYEEGE